MKEQAQDSGAGMSAKRRARVAMGGGKPDRVPVIPQICPPHAVRAAGLPYEETVVDILRRPAEYDLLVARCAADYGVDGIRVWCAREPQCIEWSGDTAYAMDPATGQRMGMVDFKGGGGVLRLPECRRRLTEADVEAVAVPDADAVRTGDAMRPLRKVAAHCGEELFVIGVAPLFTLSTMFPVQGMETTLIDVIERPEFIEAWTERHLQSSIAHAVGMAEIGVDAFYIGETFGQFLSPESFRRLCLPYMQQFVQTLRPQGPLIYVHMCGRIGHLFDLIAEIGADCLEPLDELGGTRVAEVEEALGARMALMGGVRTDILARGTVEQVRRESSRCIREAGRNGRFILAAGDMLPTETAPEKVRAMVAVAREQGSYA